MTCVHLNEVLQKSKKTTYSVQLGKKMYTKWPAETWLLAGKKAPSDLYFSYWQLFAIFFVPMLNFEPL